MGPPDHRSFVAALATEYGRRLRRFLTARLHDAQDAPDLAQEVFLRLLRHDQHDKIRSPEAYLFTIASHVIHQHAVRSASEPVSVDISDVLGELRTLITDDPPAQTEYDQRINELEQTLADLPPRTAAALVLHRLHGYTVQEIGDQLGVTRETVKKYLVRAIEHCRNRRMQEE